MTALQLVETIPGWLLPEEAEEIYNLARSSSGPILEIGTHRGRSTVLIALALESAGSEELVYTVDVDRRAQSDAVAAAQTRSVAERIVFVHGTIAAFFRAYPHVRPAFTFVDGDHRHAGVTRDLAALEQRVPDGGILLFHDFHDPRNDDPECTEIKVQSAVMSGWVSRDCRFEGVFGSCGMFTRRTAPPPLDAQRVELLALDTPRQQYLHRLRYPAGRQWRRLKGRAKAATARLDA